MTVGGGFRRLTRLLRRLERNGWTIDSIDHQRFDRLQSRESFQTQIGCYWTGTDEPLETIEVLHDLCERGDRLEVNPLIHHVESAQRVDAVLECTVRFGENGAARTENSTDTDWTPLHRDVERLQRLYNEYATFDEMAVALDGEVSAETIRRYTIEHGIHQPAQSRQWSDPALDSHESVQALDGNSSQMDGTHLEEIVSAVERGNTLYDVQRSLGMSRARTIRVLRELNLLDLVVGRIDEVGDRDVRRETIHNRLRSRENGDQYAIAVGRNG